MALVATNYVIRTARAGVQPIWVTQVIAAHPVGALVIAEDSVQGEGKFVYLPGCASTVIGSLVTFDSQGATGATALASTSTPNNALAVAMSANVAGQYGWYQTVGFNPNVVGVATCAANARTYLSATAGSLTTTSTASCGIEGAAVGAAVSGGYAGVQLGNPASNGNS